MSYEILDPVPIEFAYTSRSESRTIIEHNAIINYDSITPLNRALILFLQQNTESFVNYAAYFKAYLFFLSPYELECWCSDLIRYATSRIKVSMHIQTLQKHICNTA